VAAVFSPFGGVRLAAASTMRIQTVRAAHTDKPPARTPETGVGSRDMDDASGGGTARLSHLSAAGASRWRTRCAAPRVRAALPEMTRDCGAACGRDRPGQHPGRRAAGERPPRVAVIGVGVLARVDRLPDAASTSCSGACSVADRAGARERKPYRLVRGAAARVHAARDDGSD